MSSGLEGVVAGQSAICTVKATGSVLHYRGYKIEDLADQSSFEEVAYLLIYEKLPSSAELAEFKLSLKKSRALPDSLKLVLEQIPASTHPMDVLRTGCSFLGTLEPENDKRSGQHIAMRLIAAFPAILIYWYHFAHNQKRIETELSEDSTAAYFLHLLKQREPETTQVDMLNTSLILYAEHEFNASTFAARVIAGTLSDFYSAICGAIGALRGPLHGGANEQAFYLINNFDSADEAAQQIKQMLQEKKRIMGFGHRVYKDCDPRSDIIRHWCKKLADESGESRLYDVSARIEKVMHEEKHLFPNVDFFSASAYAYCKIPTKLFTPIFVLSRIAGWSAHILEQRADNRLIRPLSEYIGPDELTYIPLSKR